LLALLCLSSYLWRFLPVVILGPCSFFQGCPQGWPTCAYYMANFSSAWVSFLHVYLFLGCCRSGRLGCLHLHLSWAFPSHPPQALLIFSKLFSVGIPAITWPNFNIASGHCLRFRSSCTCSCNYDILMWLIETHTASVSQESQTVTTSRTVTGEP
jgi:hypothetical protein